MHGLISRSSICYWQDQPDYYHQFTALKPKNERVRFIKIRFRIRLQISSEIINQHANITFNQLVLLSKPKQKCPIVENKTLMWVHINRLLQPKYKNTHAFCIIYNIARISIQQLFKTECEHSTIRSSFWQFIVLTMEKSYFFMGNQVPDCVTWNDTWGLDKLQIQCWMSWTNFYFFLP